MPIEETKRVITVTDAEDKPAYTVTQGEGEDTVSIMVARFSFSPPEVDATDLCEATIKAAGQDSVYPPPAQRERNSAAWGALNDLCRLIEEADADVDESDDAPMPGEWQGIVQGARRARNEVLGS